MSNPYSSPIEPTSNLGGRQSDASKVKFARLAWQAPLVGLGCSFFINLVAKPAGAIGGAIFIGSVFVGLAISVVAIWMSFRYKGVALRAIIGLVLNTLLALAIVAMFFAVHQYHQRLDEQRIQSRDCDCPRHSIDNAMHASRMTPTGTFHMESRLTTA